MPMKALETLVERGIFGSRWLLLPIYLGMIVAQGMYSWKFLEGLWHLGHELLHPTATDVFAQEAAFLMIILGLVDFLMVANLIVMVVIGGYATFVSKLDLDDHTDRPAWLDHIDPGTLKTKLAGALIGVSGIHLLQTFTQVGLAMKPALAEAAKAPDTNLVMWQVVIHLTFVVSTIILAWSDLLLEKKLVMAHREGVDDKPV